jgi:hypothetical protein
MFMKNSVIELGCLFKVKDSEDSLTLSNALTCSDAHTSLDLSSNNIGEEGGRSIANLIKNSSSLQILLLEYNNLRGASSSIAESITVNNSLTFLSLRGNDLELPTLQKLAEALKLNFTLRKLDLSHCNIRSKGAQILAQAFLTNCSLIYLNLSLNDIGNQGAQALAQSLHSNSTLCALDISASNIGNLAGRYFALLIENNNTLLSLDLSKNKMGVKTLSKITQSLKDNHTIFELNLSFNVPSATQKKKFYYLNRNIRTFKSKCAEVGSDEREHPEETQVAAKLKALHELNPSWLKSSGLKPQKYFRKILNKKFPLLNPHQLVDFMLDYVALDVDTSFKACEEKKMVPKKTTKPVKKKEISWVQHFVQSSMQPNSIIRCKL